MAKPDIAEVIKEFEGRKATLESFCQKTKELIADTLREHNIPFQSIQWRIKSKDKLARKFLDPKKNYEKLDDITDLAGLRVIVYLDADAESAEKQIRSEFEIDPANTSDKRVKKPHEFGYTAINLVCRHLPHRLADVQFKKFVSVVAEIQVTTVLMHAWAEIEHSWYDMNDDYPEPIQRRFHQLAALLELADSQFRELSAQKEKYQNSVTTRVEADAAGVPALGKSDRVPLDIVSLSAFIRFDPFTDACDESVAKVLGGRIATDPNTSWLSTLVRVFRELGLEYLDDVAAELKIFSSAIPDYVSKCKQEIWLANRGAKLPHGFVLLMMATMLALSSSEETKAKVGRLLGSSVAHAPKRQIALARELAFRHPRSKSR